MGSRKKHRNRESEFYGNDGGGVNNPLGVDFNSLSSLFGNIDQNQLMSMIQMLGQNGVNMDNFNSGAGQNTGNAFNSNGNAFNNMAVNNEYDKQKNTNDKYEGREKGEKLDTSTLINKLMGNNTDLDFTENEKIYEEVNRQESIKKEKKNIENDPNIEMLLAIRKIVSKERVRFIDKTIQLYINGEFGEF
ncbi:MAG: hypothetical protein ACRC30_10305 [Clostridium sp.]